MLQKTYQFIERLWGFVLIFDKDGGDISRLALSE